jgi:hypothetical protein
MGLPAVCHAQSYSDERQNPKQYTNEQSEPLRLMAYFVAPVGFLLEWGIVRPIHYIATDTFLAPALGGDTRPPTYVPPFPPMEPEAGSTPLAPAVASASAALPPTEVKPAAPPSEAPSPPDTAVSKPSKPATPKATTSTPAQAVIQH